MMHVSLGRVIFLAVAAAAALPAIVASPEATAAEGLGHWRNVESMGAARTGHTATTLDGPACRGASPAAYCGKVLIVGGRHSLGKGSFVPLVSAELYDPATASWSPTAGLSEARSRHSATLLDGAACQSAPPPVWCGTVLVAGGAGEVGLLSSAELYDPVAARWSRVGDQVGARAAHTATELIDGRVLVAGGSTGMSGSSARLESAEIFDPASRTWNATAPMAMSRAGHTATLLPSTGKVLVRGGAAPGCCVPPPTDVPELFDPSGAGAWSSTPGALPISDHTATLLDDDQTVLIVGAEQTQAGPVGTAMLYDSVANTWRPTAPPQETRSRHTATLLSKGEVLVGGGSIDLEKTASATSEVYNPATEVWRTSGSLVSARADHTATRIGDDTVLVAGGTTTPASARAPSPEMIPQRMLAAAELFDVASTAQLPSIASIEPASGPSSGGSVTIQGAGFAGATGITFGSAPAVAFTVDSPTRITTSYPRRQEGSVVDVAVTTATGTSAKVRSSHFTYAESSRYWQSGDEIYRARSNPTATLLTGPECSAEFAQAYCGNLLLLGNDAKESQNYLLSVPDSHHRSNEAVRGDLFDPIKGAFGDIDGRRGGIARGHTATMLDRAVLVAGGDQSLWTRVTGGGNYHDIAVGGEETYVYDPAGRLTNPNSPPSETNGTDVTAWRESGPLQVGRSTHTATLLPGGKILAVGGVAPVMFQFPEGPEFKVDEEGNEYENWHSTGSSTRGVVPFASAELYDPAAKTITRVDDMAGGGSQRAATREEEVQGAWSLIDSLATARSEHSATLLADGRVLVVGGHGRGGVALRSAELYDPTSASWSSAADLLTARFGHTATLRKDGTVLVTGGIDSHGVFLDEAEIYDPSSGIWRIAPSVHTARTSHSATLLNDGAVAIVGGIGNDGRVLESSEMLGSGAQAWVPTAALGTARGGHAASLLSDGRVLVAGGTERSGIVVSEGRSTELLQLQSPPVVTGIEPPAGSTFGGTQVRISGSGFRDPVTGVRFGDVAATDFLRVSETEVMATSPPQAQGDVSVTVTTATGTSSPGPIPDNKFHYAPGTWKRTEPMRDGRSDHSATALPDGKVLVAGGSTASSVNAVRLVRTPTGQAELYDPEKSSWTGTAPMGVPRFTHTATLLQNDMVLVAGGSSEPSQLTPAALRSAELYDSSAGVWRTTGSLNDGRFAHTATLLDSPRCDGAIRPIYCGKVLVVGGSVDERLGQPLPSVEMFDPDGGTWRFMASLTSCQEESCRARTHHTATLLPDGKVLVAGGLGPGSDCEDVTLRCSLEALRTSQIYDPLDDRWTAASDLAGARFGHTATLLDRAPCGGNCGKVLVAGGQGSIPTTITAEGFLASAELFDPAQAGWTSTGNLHRARGGHTASTLADGTVVVAGSAQVLAERGGAQPPAANRYSAEIYVPAFGTWILTSFLASLRGQHTATVLEGPACTTPGTPPAACGSMLVTGGAAHLTSQAPLFTDAQPELNSAELYIPAPRILALQPARGPARGATRVIVSGFGFAGANAVSFGGRPATGLVVNSPSQITGVSPAHPRGPADVAVEGPGGTSAHLVPDLAARFGFLDPPNRVDDLIAVAVGETGVRLNFTARDDGSGTASATDFVIKQSLTPLNEDNFDAATSLCDGGVCTFRRAVTLSLEVFGLAPGSTYHYALRARSPVGELGPISNVASVATDGVAPATGPTHTTCAAPGEVGAGQVLYPAGYSLVGLPGATALPSVVMYGWDNQGAGGDYVVVGPHQAVSGRGYWAYFSCPKLVELGAGQSRVRLNLGAYRASMVGNPSSISQAKVSGHDFAAKWDPAANGGVGGYSLSGYQEAGSLRRGEGLWVFSYRDTTVEISE